MATLAAIVGRLCIAALFVLLGIGRLTDPAGAAFPRWIALITVAAVGLVAVYAPGFWRRLPILIGAALGYFAYLVLANGFGVGAPIDFSKVGAAPWLGLPQFTSPVFSGAAISLIAPVAIILVAENLGHIKAIGAMTGRNLDPYLGRAFMGDGVATMVSGFFGGAIFMTLAYLLSVALLLVGELNAVLHRGGRRRTPPCGRAPPEGRAPRPSGRCRP